MTDYNKGSLEFGRLDRREIVADFDGGDLTGDAGRCRFTKSISGLG